MNFIPYSGHLRVILRDEPQDEGEEFRQLLNDTVYQHTPGFEIDVMARQFVASLTSVIEDAKVQELLDQVYALPGIEMAYFVPTADPDAAFIVLHPTDLSEDAKAEVLDFHLEVVHQALLPEDFDLDDSFTGDTTIGELEEGASLSTEEQAKLNVLEAAIEEAFPGSLGGVECHAGSFILPSDSIASLKLIDALWDVVVDGEHLAYLPSGDHNLIITVIKGSQGPNRFNITNLKEAVAWVSVGKHPLNGQQD